MYKSVLFTILTFLTVALLGALVFFQMQEMQHSICYSSSDGRTKNFRTPLMMDFPQARFRVE
jgi:hypothetical protein